MHEIVIVHNDYYEAGENVNGNMLLEKNHKDKELWWFNGPYTSRDLGLVFEAGFAGPGNWSMPCEAVRFTFEFVPNLSQPEHFQHGSSYMRDEFEHGKGFDLFEADMPDFIRIIRRKIKESEYGALFTNTHFYALYEVNVYPQSGPDGDFCDIEVEPILLGELDIYKIERALVEEKVS